MKILYSLIALSFFSLAHANEIDITYPNGNADSGKKLFFSKNSGSFESCSSCHSDNLKNFGQHAKTNREIKPLAPIANPERLTDLTKTEKWLKRNCNDVLGHECSSKEKADIIAFLRSIK